MSTFGTQVLGSPAHRLAACLLLWASTLAAATLPDTGQDVCFGTDLPADSAPPNSADSIARDNGPFPRQDCRYGLDAGALFHLIAKVGAGAKGFDYTKIRNNGTDIAPGSIVLLGTAATDWACTRDNLTGLTWEVKTAGASDLRHTGHTYTWYSTNAATNGGSTGSTGSNTCNATLPGSLCNTQAFVAAVNAAALCTYTDWRMPTQRELLTLVYHDNLGPSIEDAYFPNTDQTSYWSGTPSMAFLTSSWFVEFAEGATGVDLPPSDFSVRLVRGATF